MKYITTITPFHNLNTCEIAGCNNHRKTVNGKVIHQYCNHHTRRLVSYGDPVLEMPVLSEHEVKWLNHHFDKALLMVDDSRIKPLRTLIERYNSVGLKKAVQVFTTPANQYGFYKSEIKRYVRNEIKSLESFIGGCVMLCGQREMMESFIKAELRTRLIIEPHLYSSRMQTTHWLSYALNQPGCRFSEIFRRPTKTLLRYFTILREQYLTRIMGSMLFGDAEMYKTWGRFRKVRGEIHPDMPHIQIYTSY